MKKFIFAINILGLLVFSGCEDFLKEEIRGIVSPNNFYNTDEEAIQAANGLYKDIRSPRLYGDQGGAGLEIWTMYGADEVGPTRESQFGPSCSYSISEGNYLYAWDLWKEAYATVGDANSVIANATENPRLSENIQKQLVGEALFMRSLVYYHLTNLWGDVPYFRESLSFDQVAGLGRTDETLIRNEIVADLTRIEEESLLPSSYSSSKDLGRVTIWAAKILKAKIMLWQKDWEGVRDACVSIINDSPHTLLNNYDDVFNINNQYNNEIIWGVDFMKDVEGNTITRTDGFNPRLRDEPLKSSERNALSAALLAIGQEFNGFGSISPEPDLVNKFPLNDLRRPITIVSEYLGYKLNYQYMAKFWNLDKIISPRGNHGELKVVFRLADVYLMAAEAENELNGPENAYQYINKVRERAYEPDQPLSGLTQQELREKLFDERKWELAAEGHRRYDLIRWGILLQTVQNTEVRVYKEAKINIKPYHIKLPIPLEELALNPALIESDPTNNGYRGL